MGSKFQEGGDEIADILRARQWADWRGLRFLDIKSREVSEKISELAVMVKDNIAHMERILSASAKVDTKAHEAPAGASRPQVGDLVARFIKEQDSSTHWRKFFFDGPEKSVSSGSSKRRTRTEGGYRIYTTEFDEIVLAKELLSQPEAEEFSRAVSGGATLVEALHKGQLKSLEQSLEELGKDSSVAAFILVDNSGSLRGRPVTYTAAWTLVLLEMLDRIGFKTAAAGFTTRAWKGGESRKKWLLDGRPPRPGRLNDLRYIVYKSFDETVRTSASNLGLMLKEGILKENIDGEAVAWARSILEDIQAEQKVLIVLSDGAPVDDSTIGANAPDFLTQHLSKAVRDLRKTQIQLVAVGVDHDVSIYYGKDGIASTAEKLGIDVLRGVEAKLSALRRKKVTASHI